MADFLRSLAIAVAPVVVAKLLDVTLEQRTPEEPAPESFAAYVRRVR